jgi:hypothetical protein
MKELAKYISEDERIPYKDVLENIEEEEYTHYDIKVYSFEGREYAVGTDEECDYAWRRSLEEYLQECIYPKLPENVVNYFDDEKWIQDAEHDGRDHSLATYDGEEIELDNNLYAYRIN